jgi:predicted RNA polymerase sigma factor
MPRYVWDAEMVARAAGLKRAGFTAKAIAERLGVTEDAVANRMSRAKARVRLDGKSGKYSFPKGPMTSDILQKMQRVEEYLEQPEKEDQ